MLSHLQGTQRKILSVANTLGLSRNVIGQIDRRSVQDKWIMIAGICFTLFAFYYILKLFG